jgi:hypothetical protein
MKIQNNKSKEIPNPEISLVLNPNLENFDFEIWAHAVRNQMLAVLRGNLSQNRAKTLTD